MREDRPKLYGYVCPYCLKQHTPHVDHNLGMRQDVRWIADEEGDERGARQCLKGRKDGICPDHGPTAPSSPVNSGERVRA